MIDRIPDTPIRRSTHLEDSLSQGAEDSEFETVATVPLYQHLQATTQGSTVPTQPLHTQKTTQPTQIIERITPQKSSPLKNASIVQVATSSPLAPHSSLSRYPFSRPGALSTAIAPPGTRFKPPAMAAPVRRQPILDDEGPTYRGGSSDEDDFRLSAIDIKPSTFTNISKSFEKDRVAESPVALSNTAKFKEITASAFYNPAAPKSQGKREADAGNAIVQAPTTKRPRNSLDSPSFEAFALADIEDYNVRTKIERIRRIFPNKSVEVCLQILLLKKGNYEDTIDHIAALQDPATVNLTSDDELSLDNNSAPAAAPVVAAKQQIKAGTRIQDKWAATQRVPQQPKVAEPPIRRRLIRGARSRRNSPSPSPAATQTTRIGKMPGRLVQGKKRVSKSPSSSPGVSHIDSDSDSDSVSEKAADDGTLLNKVLNFFNTCSVEDLTDIAELTPDVAECFVSNRPYVTLAQVRMISANETPAKDTKARKPKKLIGDKIVDKSLDMWTGYEAVDALVKRCEALGKPIADEMKSWGIDIFGAKKTGELEMVSLDKISSSHDSGIGSPSSSASGNEFTKKKFIGQPSIMSENIKMKDYQIVGINWLNLLFEQNLSCILADDMGLGKTCQVIAFLAHLFETGVRGPHLVVVPSSTLENWLREFSVFCPKLNVMPYYAGQNERANIRLQIQDERDNINVVITTYTIAKAKHDASFLASMGFCACIFDEGHMLKSSKSLLYNKLIRIPARFRLLLTGTPLQNNLQELASLLGFILPQVFRERKDDLDHIFSAKAKTIDVHSTLLSAQRIARAKSMLTPFVLRRKKHQVIDLPPKIARVEYCTMNDAQKEIYQYQTDMVREILADRAAGKKVGNKTTNILMKLRQAAIHPLFYRRIYDEKTLSRIAKACVKDPKWAMSDPDAIYEELLPYSDFECHTLCSTNPDSLGKFALKNDEWMNSGKVEKLRGLLQTYIENGDRVLIFSQFTMVMDILEQVLETLHIRFFRLDGTTSVEDRQSILDAFYEQVDIPVFMLSTKAGGAGINLACANKVIIFDSSFNPQDDIQAENRAHRVGQTREVEVVRLVTKDTIEEKIYALGQTKLVLDQRVAGEEDGGKKGEEVGMKVVEAMVMKDLALNAESLAS
ncbi:DNA-dependent ATPase fun30 [Ophidiomyces ophidiicola]|nr:DNA-dependent ATPase fun30 [Ophidiomyces ophidiicola]KAI1984783.1 DNA-dependent ATPase fun30 [Ophidiomyces ophidiicola]KAI1992182.1 DNA-dependent ATPase fun30 [Ophidiomyces ophidiicola]KAI2003066.1 DNA-dependent ATPase fun30 [Ophidiomyces ophidiicola]